MHRLRFELEATAPGSSARAGRLHTLHGEVLTPVFMPVGTQATVKGLPVEDLLESGAQVLLANAYHLLLRPGPEVFRHVGGIHRFMNWSRPILTDSGGFQVFSLPNERVITEDGAVFKSYVDGRTIVLSPEHSIATQLAIGSDMLMAMDVCVPSTSDRDTAAAAMERTHRWAARSLDARGDAPQALFGIVQGACFDDLRRESADVLTRMPFDGFAVGGLAVGETKHERERCTALVTALLPQDRPRYLMGVGTPIDLLEAVDRGIDMFDCTIPSSLAKQGVVYTSTGRFALSRGVYKLADVPIDAQCPCPTCAHYSRAYLHHLIKAGEPLAWTLLTRHNLRFYHELMSAMRGAILDGTFATFRDERRPLLERIDDEHPSVIPVARRRRRGDDVLARFDVRIAEEGHASIVDRVSGEIMHAGLDPQTEARALYVEQSHLAQRLREITAAPLVIWDVGLGAAHNAMAAIACIEASDDRASGDDTSGNQASDDRASGDDTSGNQASDERQRATHLVSFENDVASLRLALRNGPRFPHLRGPAPGKLLRFGEWCSERVPLRWSLLEGDFLERLTDAPPPDLIFWDPFSPKTDTPLWTLDCFERVFAACSERDVELFTYSTSTAIRAALVAAGFVIARGAPTGPKPETTIAMTPAALPHAARRGRTLFGADWLERWQRSDARWPSDVTPETRDAFAERIRGARQLRGSW